MFVSEEHVCLKFRKKDRNRVLSRAATILQKDKQNQNKAARMRNCEEN